MISMWKPCPSHQTAPETLRTPRTDGLRRRLNHHQLWQLEVLPASSPSSTNTNTTLMLWVSSWVCFKDQIGFSSWILHRILDFREGDFLLIGVRSGRSYSLDVHIGIDLIAPPPPPPPPPSTSSPPPPPVSILHSVPACSSTAAPWRSRTSLGNVSTSHPEQLEQRGPNHSMSTFTFIPAWVLCRFCPTPPIARVMWCTQGRGYFS